MIPSSTPRHESSRVARHGRQRVTALALALAAVALAACSSDTETQPVPLDRFVFPGSVALHDGKLLVVSTNFDLRYDRDRGGSLLSVDPATEPATFDGGFRFPSFGGEIAVAEAGECGLASPLAFVPSRVSSTLYKVALGAGAPACGDGCAIPLPDGPEQPYGVALSCPPGGTARAWVGYLSSPDNLGHITAIELQPDGGTGPRHTITIGTPRARSFAYDAERERIFLTTVEAGLQAPLVWLELAGNCAVEALEAEGGCPIRSQDLSALVAGIDLRGVALSNPQPGLARRIYIAARVFDAQLAAAIGGRPANDLAGVLLVLEQEPTANGGVRLQLVRTVPVGLGASEVRVLPPRAAGQRDLVAVTAVDDGLLSIYDDAGGAIAKVFAHDPTTGAPVIGRQPFGIAVEARGASARLYVTSFDRGFVTPVDVPLDAPWNAALVLGTGVGTPVRRIGQETP